MDTNFTSSCPFRSMSEAIIAFIATDVPWSVHPANWILGAAARSSHRGLPFTSLACAKSPVSRTSGTIYVVTCVENVLVRTSRKETWIEFERVCVETKRGQKVSRESDGKRLGSEMCDGTVVSGCAMGQEEPTQELCHGSQCGNKRGVRAR